MKKEDNKRKVAIYMRLGNSNEGELEKQEKIIKDYTSHLGVKVDEVYSDNGYSGMNFDRPGFKRLIEDVNNDMINTIYILNMSRLSRDIIKTNEYLHRVFPTHNVTLVSIQDRVSNIEETLMVNAMINSIKELQHKELSNRIKMGRKRRTVIKEEKNSTKKEETVR